MKFVDVSKYGFIVEPRYYFFGWTNSPVIIGRPSAVKALVKARKFLPKGYNFKIWDMQRSLKAQLLMIKSFRKRLKLLYPKLKGTEFDKLLFTFAAKPLKKVTRLGTHRLGGAVDLTIIDQSGEELFMGSDHDDLTTKARLDYYEAKQRLSSLEQMALRNRRMLKSVMTKAGFSAYLPEWWHWNYEK
ncbi:MAG TPA: M15 family metallopeptidase [Patescibacteria group bacterium]|jgi:D-alanyl-D-alanine dipeptidase|nr:M15 family metallopeptidase [Patescibacteria group bacterium]